MKLPELDRKLELLCVCFVIFVFIVFIILIMFVIAFMLSPCSPTTSSHEFSSVGGTPRITFSHAIEHAYQQPSFSPPPPPQQGCRRCALLSSISVFVIIFIVIVIIAIIAIIASRSLLSAATQHITRACVEGHHKHKTSFSPPSRPVQGRCCPFFYLISVLMDSGFRVFL